MCPCESHPGLCPKVFCKANDLLLSSQGFDGFFPVAGPLFPQFPRTECCLSRCFPVEAHVRALVVVEVDSHLQRLPDFLYGAKGHVLEQLVLDDAVDALGHGVVLGVSALGHADPDAVCLEDACIGIAGILYAAVGVMDQVRGRIAFKAAQGHLQGFDGKPGLKRLADAPAYNLLGVVVGDKRKVAEGVFVRLAIGTDGHIGDVAHPQLVGAYRDEFPDQVGVQGKVVAGVCRPGAAAPPADLEAVLVYDVVEAVVAHAVFFAERGTVHTPQLAAADAAVLLTDAPDILHTERLLGKLAHGCVAMLVVGLGRHTKQPTQRRDTVLLHVASV